MKDALMIAGLGIGGLIALSMLQGKEDNKKGASGSGIVISLPNAQQVPIQPALRAVSDKVPKVQEITKVVYQPFENATKAISEMPKQISSGIAGGITQGVTGGVSELLKPARAARDFIGTALETTKKIADAPANTIRQAEESINNIGRNVHENVIQPIQQAVSRGAPLGAVGFAVGGTAGALAGGAIGNALYEIGTQIGHATANIGTALIEATGGTQSPIYQAGQFFANLWGS